MNLFKQTNSPFWFVNFTDRDTGKRIKRTTKETKKGAALVIAERMVRAHHDKAEETAQDTSNAVIITLKDALDRYVTSLEGASKSSAAQARASADKTQGIYKKGGKGRFKLDPTRLMDSLTPSDMEDLVQARRKEGNSAQTIAHEIKFIRAATNHAAAMGFTYPPKMEVRGANNPWRLPRLSRKTRYLSAGEWASVYEFLSPDRPLQVKSRTGKPYLYPLSQEIKESRQDIRDMYVILTLTGGRWSEVANMTWDKVDTKTFSTIRLFGSKTQRERLVPAPSMAVEVLKRRYAARKSVLIFPGKDGLAARSQHACTVIIKAMDTCGLNRADIVADHGRATVHSLRHTCASWLIQAGAGLSEVQDILGHSTLEMTLRYAHLSKERTANKLAGMLDTMEHTQLFGQPELAE